MQRRPNRRDFIAAGGLMAASLAGCLGYAGPADDDGTQSNDSSEDVFESELDGYAEPADGDENQSNDDPEEEFENELEWGGQGSEFAELDCPDDTGYWKWVLAPGGRTPIEEGAQLTVTFEDSTEVTAEGYRPGEGRGAVHFDVFEEGGGTVDSAIVKFDGGGDNTILTISEAFCEEETPESEVRTLPASAINGSTAMLHGELTEMGDLEEVTVYFEWRNVEDVTWMRTDDRTVSRLGPFGAQISGLELSNRYEFRAVAEADDVRVVGGLEQFVKEEEPTGVYWQVDFGEGENVPIPPNYWPDDGFWALGTDHGVLENPSGARTQTDGQLGDVTIEDSSYEFDDDDEPEEVSITFTVEEGGESRYLHLAVFVLPGPFALDEIEEQELYDEINGEYAGGDTDTLTLPLPQP